MIAPVRILQAGVDDVPKVLALEQATPEAPHWTQAVYSEFVVGEATALQEKALFVALAERGLQGFAAASLVAGEAELESMAVAAAARRLGLGSRLLDAVRQWAAALGARTLRLEVRSANGPARAFYQSQGFVAEGLRRGYYKAPVDDAVLLRLDLRSGRAAGRSREL